MASASEQHDDVYILSRFPIVKIFSRKVSNQPVAESPSEWTPRSSPCRLTWPSPPWRARPLDKEDRAKSFMGDFAGKTRSSQQLFRTPVLRGAPALCRREFSTFSQQFQSVALITTCAESDWCCGASLQSWNDSPRYCRVSKLRNVSSEVKAINWATKITAKS